MRFLLYLALLSLAAASISAQKANVISPASILQETAPAQLSSFGFFTGSALFPSGELIPYSLATPLFSDYAEKQRFIYLPPGKQVSVGTGVGRITFPVGAAIIKNFGYPGPDGKLKIIETRVLLNQQQGWTALPYVWNADGSDADLRIGGARSVVNLSVAGIGKRQISYAVPNKNQCKQCHNQSGNIQPIGPILGNMRFPSSTTRNRFLMAARVPPYIEKMAAWDDADALIADRAKSYLYVNCAHCHRPTGSASNSGLFFDETAIGPTAQGIGKHPVAAGRGSGGLEFVIAPGYPEQSILLHRLESLDPGVAMPELGRASVHTEGAALLRQWIAEMPKG
jgi:uncharacterized repeat protein (TIGR03806 family)